MIASAAAFIVPGAIDHHPTFGGFGIALGVITGFAGHTIGHRLGLSIVSHKGPVGYAAARRLVREERPTSMLYLPAAGVGLAPLSVAVLGSSAQGVLSGAVVRALVFGFAAGIFLHIAMDFLPRCETGSEIHEALTSEGRAHEVLDRLRVHAVVSTTLGGLAVFAAWLLVGSAA